MKSSLKIITAAIVLAGSLSLPAFACSTCGCQDTKTEKAVQSDKADSGKKDLCKSCQVKQKAIEACCGQVHEH